MSRGKDALCHRFSTADLAAPPRLRVPARLRAEAKTESYLAGYDPINFNSTAGSQGLTR
jgi:hypothetical protein